MEGLSGNLHKTRFLKLSGTKIDYIGKLQRNNKNRACAKVLTHHF